MDEVGPPGWTLHPATRSALRLEHAKTALFQRELHAAILEAEELLDEDPDHVDALHVLAEALMDLGDMAVARATWDHLICLVGPKPYLLVQRGSCAFEVADVDDALRDARAALNADPDHALAWFLLGEAQHRSQADKLPDALWQAHRRAPLACPLPLFVDDADWPKLFDEAFGRLSAPAAAVWDGVPVLWLEFPPLDELQRVKPPISPRALALYEGEPPEVPALGVRPKALRLFKGNLRREADEGVLVDHLALALETEAADWMVEDE